MYFKPWYNPPWIWKSSLKVTLTLKKLWAFLCISYCIILTNHPSTPSSLKAHHTISPGTQSKAFFKSTNAKYKFLFFAKYFSYNCFKIKVGFLVPHHRMKPNCLSSMSTNCLINFSIIFSAIFRILIHVHYSFLFRKNLLSHYNDLKWC